MELVVSTIDVYLGSMVRRYSKKKKQEMDNFKLRKSVFNGHEILIGV